jgi:integrase
MARGFVKKREDVWYAYWRDLQGKQHAKAVSPRKKDAEKYLDTVQATVHAGTYREIEDVTFSVFAKRWLEDYASVSVKASTLATYTSRINGPYTVTFGPLKLSQIGTADVQHYLAGLTRKKLSAATIRAHLVLLRNMLGHAVAWGHLAHNPASAVKGPKLPHTEMQSLTPAEVTVFLAACDDQHRALFATAVMTGVRLGELLALQWDDVNWRAGTIRVRRSLYNGQFVEPKTSRSVRVIGMSNRLAAILLEHKLAAPYSPFDLVFPTPEGTPMDPANLRKRVFTDTLTRAKLHKIRIHDLRHTFASLLINQGENLEYVQAQLGHSSITTTVDRYGHLMPDAHRGASDRLDATLFGDSRQSLDDKMLTNARGKEKARSPMGL